MIGPIRQLKALFNRRERRQLGVLSCALVVRAGVEVVGVGSIAPFMKVVADPSVVSRNEWLHRAYEMCGFTSTTAFLIGLGVVIVMVLAVSNALSALAVWGMLRFSWATYHRLSTRLLRGYLAQPYSFFVARNSASFTNTIFAEVQQVCNGVLTPVLNVITRALVVVALCSLLVVLDPVLAAIVVVVLGGAYGGVYLLVKAKQRRLGRERVAANQLRFRVAAEAFGGIKDVKVLQREQAFASRFDAPSSTFAKATVSNLVVAQVPRYLLETVAFGGIVMIVLYYLQAGHGLESILPTISIYAFAGYRLMPELQQLYAALAAIRFNHAALDELARDLVRFAPNKPTENADGAFAFNEAIHFENVTFRYQEGARAALDALSLSIPCNHTIGLVGASGSGKTTLVDLLLGLYEPESGHIRIDGTTLSEATVGAWRHLVGYVPQHIFLCDDTIANNIAFGVKPEDVDCSAVEQAARTAHLHDFIQTLPSGYHTVVGERGVRLSGGQRQRIGIARALYHKPEVLIMDEATSALDGATEAGVMDAISELSGHKTIVLIAHRLTTVAKCDRIYLIEGGRVVDRGVYEDLLANSTAFRELAMVEPPTVTGENARRRSAREERT